MGIADYFNQGVARGWSMSREAETAKAARTKAEEEKKLKLDLKSAFESNPDLAPEDAGRAEAFNAYNAKIANEDADTFGVKYDPAGYAQGNAPKSQTDVTVARNMSIAKALAGAGDYRGVMAAQQAADQARVQERDSVRQDRKDVVEQQRTNLEMQKNKLGISKMTAEQEQAEKTKAFDSKMNELFSTGQKLDAKQVFAIAQEHGVPNQYAGKMYLEKLGIDEKTALASVNEKLITLKDAATKGLPALMELADPDPNDNKKPEVVKNKDGSLTLMYAGKPMQGFEKLPAENTAAVIYTQLEGIYKGNPFAAAALIAEQEMNKAKLAEVQSKTGEHEAKSNYYDAYAGYRTARANAAEEDGGELTIPQQRTNSSIDTARRQLTGMTDADVLKRTQSTTNTGRENLEYDPNLAALVKLARSRKYGEDPEHDKFAKPAQPAKPTAQVAQTTATRHDVAKKFRADHTMHAHKLGKETEHGVEVLDRSGKLIGYYR